MCFSNSSLHSLILTSMRLIPTVLLIQTTCFMLIACNDDETTTSEMTAGEATAGEATAGESTAGEATAGEVTAGEATAGEATAGEATAGEATAGEATAGEVTAGEVTAGEVTAGEVTAGEVTAGEVVELGLPLSSLISQTATAMCQGLINCCNMQDHELFFAPFINNPRYEEIIDQLPPNTPFNEENCEATIELALTSAPFGRWIEQVNESRVTYDGEAAQTCLDTLQAAECGDDFLNAVYDSTCLSFLPPMGGNNQRKMFSRTATLGADCVALNDGQGGVIYGTCDPMNSFCCVRRDDGTCKVAEQDEVGECIAVSEIGEPCSLLPSAQVCATGNECGYDSGICEMPMPYITVQLGDICAENFSFFGLCEDSYCDVSGTGTCLPLKADGESCVFPDECVNGSCNDQVCGSNTYCR